MSWAETGVINSNMKKTLNEQLQSHSFNIIEVITATGTYTPNKTGLYRVICVGAGGAGTFSGTSRCSSGGGGGVAIKDMLLESTKTYNVTVSTTSSFGTEITATSGSKALYNGTTLQTPPYGGAASGGTYNFPGEQAFSRTTVNSPIRGGSLQCVIPELSEVITVADLNRNLLSYGNSLLGYGGGGPAVIGFDTNTDKYDTNFCLPGLPAAIIIISLETEGY